MSLNNIFVLFISGKVPVSVDVQDTDTQSFCACLCIFSPAYMKSKQHNWLILHCQYGFLYGLVRVMCLGSLVLCREDPRMEVHTIGISLRLNSCDTRRPLSPS